MKIKRHKFSAASDANIEESYFFLKWRIRIPYQIFLIIFLRFTNAFFVN